MSVFGVSSKSSVCVLLLYGLCYTTVSLAWPLQDTNGNVHQLSQYKGRWLIINYWAPWCPPCLEEMPELVTLYDQADHSKVMILGVAVQYETEKSVKDYVNDMLISYPIILGEMQKQSIEKVDVLPTTYIYRPDGSLYKVKRGKVTRQWLEQIVTNATQSH